MTKNRDLTHYADTVADPEARAYLRAQIARIDDYGHRIEALEKAADGKGGRVRSILGPPTSYCSACGIKASGSTGAPVHLGCKHEPRGTWLPLPDPPRPPTDGEAVKCRGCGFPLMLANVRIADGCPCNSARGVNHGLVPKDTCTCLECDPAQTGSVRRSAPESSPLSIPEARAALDRGEIPAAVDFGEPSAATACAAPSDGGGDVPFRAELETDHRNAAGIALDEIAEICGCPEWDYPGQIVRDVQRLKARLAALESAAESERGQICDALGVVADCPLAKILELIGDAGDGLAASGGWLDRGEYEKR